MSTLLKRTEQSISRWSANINSILFKISAVAVGLMVIPTVLDVCSRFIFHSSLIGAMEVVEFLMVILVFSALGYIAHHREHIRVDLIVGKLPVSVQNILTFVGSLCPFVLILLTSYCMFLLAYQKFTGGEVSGMLGIPLGIFVCFGAMGCISLALALLSQTLKSLRVMTENRQYISMTIGICCSLLILTAAFILKDSEITDNLMVLGSSGMAVLMLLILSGMPIGFAMALIGYAGMVILYPTMESSFSMLGLTPYNTASNYVYTVVPMFILMGELAMHAGISRDLFSAASIWTGRVPGGLAIASISGCAGFAAVSGDSMATAVTMASVALPEMSRKGYHPGLSCATLAAGGTLGILIPPSTGFIFYALVTEVSIGQLFVAGVIPGILLTLIFIGIILLFALRRPDLAPRGEATTFSQKISALKGVIAMVLLIALILGGILFGWFSPNEAGAVGAAGTLLYAVARRRITMKTLFDSLCSTVRATAALMLILIGVGLLGFFFAATALPFDLADLVVSLDANKYVILLCVVIFYIIMGCLMNVIPMILLTLPAIYPSVISLGFDPVWFGVVVVVLMEMGQITPPVGINVFALSSVASDVPMASIFRYIVPFFISMLMLVMLLAVFPEIATWLPSLLF
jgi:tripartite ATP-independent transporter DctM subunit